MKLRPIIINGSVIITIISVVVWFLFNEHIISFQQEVLVSSGMTLTTQWLELKPETPMKTAADWSELFIEVPELLPHVNGFYNEHFLLADGARLQIEGYLTTDNSEKVPLDKISVAGDWRKRYLIMSSKDLQWKKRDYRFRSLTLRSNRVLATGRAVWISHDPRATKDGLAHPDLLESPAGDK
ncbi:MAG: hypothetical protein ABSG91_20020 [Syntrophobacteraceae bacterium]|jgi:hypothetical protein